MTTRRSKTPEPRARKATSATAGRRPAAADIRKQLDRRTRELARTQKLLAEALQQQAATSEALRVVSSSRGELQPVFDSLLENATRVCGASFGTMTLHEDGTFRTVALHRVPEAYLSHMQRSFRPHPKSGLGRLARSHDIVQIADLRLEAPYLRGDPSATALVDLARARTIVVVPMLVGKQLVGAIGIFNQQVRRFTDRQIELLNNFAKQAVIAIENARLLNELRESLEQQTAAADVLKVISRSAFDLKVVLDTLLRSAGRLCRADMGVVARRQEDRFYRTVAYGLPDKLRELIEDQPVELSRDSGSGRALLEGRVIRIDDIETDAEYTHLSRGTGAFRSLLGVPMMREGVPGGVMTLMRKHVQPFTDKQIELVSTFADQAAIAIENARLLGDLEEALRRQTATAEVLKAISRSTFDLPAVLHALVETAARLCDADKGTITRQKDGQFFRAESHGFSEQFMEYVRGVPVVVDRHSVTGRTLLEGVIVHIPDVDKDSDYTFREGQRLGGFRSLLGVPMLREGVPVGVITLTRTSARAFTDKQIELATTFADQAAIAIENVRLFDEVQAKTRDLEESLRYQTGSANILRVIASSPTDVNPVLEAIVKSACELCGAYDAVVRLREADGLAFGAHHGPLPFSLESVPVSENSTAGLAVIGRKPVHVHDLLSTEGDSFPYAQALAREHGERTILSVPLLREDEGIGAIVIRRREVNPFTEKQIALLQTFADQAVIAIGNVRLFEEVQARTRDLSEALQQQTATAEVLKVISRSAFELEPVFGTIVQTASRLCEAEFALIFERRGEQFEIVAANNAAEAFVKHAAGHPIPLGRGSLVGRTALERKPVHIPDCLADTAYSAMGYQAVGQYRTMLGVPLLRDGAPIGVIGLMRAAVRPFTEKQIELVTTFADQAVIAIRNVQLFDQVQERTRQLSRSLDELRAAQDRLVQTEKLASLGQLTAGIAHEIKNPLNFVNNFSALSVDLADELNDVLKQAALADKIRAEVDELTGLLKDNLGKVVQHGKRADSIVKNMLLHSRQGGGEMRLADINALVDESINLAYHGARAENPQFNVTLRRDFDPDAGMVEVFPQEITRVLLNLISNGLYAVAKRKAANGDDGFEPVVIAATRSHGDQVEIRIRDNGPGIPPDVREKIFNPFFTTKPAGEGTGLGLSMSHDIVVKQHGGRIDVETEPDAFTEFIVTLQRGRLVQTTAAESK